MKPGDKVKILPYETIRFRKDISDVDAFGNLFDFESFYSDGLLFDPAMKQYCDPACQQFFGNLYTIAGMKDKPYGTIYRVEENAWWWHENWLTLIAGDFLSDKDFEI